MDTSERPPGRSVPYVVDAVKAYATMGEIMDVFEEQYGSYQETLGVA